MRCKRILGSGFRISRWLLAFIAVVWCFAPDKGNAATQTPVTLDSNSGIVKSVAFSPDGKTLASTNAQGVKLWDLKTDTVLKKFPKYGYGVLSVAFSPDGRTLATGNGDNTVRLWDVKTGKLLRTLGNGDAFTNVAFTPDGQRLVGGNGDGSVCSVWIWDTHTGTLIRTLRPPGMGLVQSLAFSHNGRILAIGDNGIKLWSVDKGTWLETLNGHTNMVLSVAFSPDDQTLASGSADGTVRLWNVRTGSVLKTLPGCNCWIFCVLFSPDGTELVRGSMDGKITFWDVSTGSLIKTLTGHKSAVYSLAIAPDGQTMASGSDDSTLRIWHVNFGISKAKHGAAWQKQQQNNIRETVVRYLIAQNKHNVSARAY